MIGEVGARPAPALTTDEPSAEARPLDPVAPLAWRPVLLLAGLHLAGLLVVASRHGFHRDELYFLAAGRHLDWGYVDQPPLTPLLARVQSVLFGDSVLAIRVFPAVATAAAVVLAAVLARELGGRRSAQLLAAGAVAGAGFVLGAGHLLATATFDFVFWLGLICVAARLLRTEDTRWWLVFGAVAGTALWNKDLVVLLAAALLLGLAVDRRRALLRSPWLPAGGALACLLALPTLVWQAAHGWPQIEMAGAIAHAVGTENRLTLLPGQLVLLGPLLVPLGFAGTRWLLRAGHGRRFRPLLTSYLIAVGLTFVTAGRPYYPIALGTAVVVAGAVAIDEDRASGTALWLRRAPLLLAANAVLTIPLALPVLPPDALRWPATRAVTEPMAETVGWPEMVDTVAAVVHRLPPAERDRVVLLAGSYGEAGALERFGPERRLPRPYSGHNAYWHWARPIDAGAPVVAVRLPVGRLAPYFDRCNTVARVDNHHQVDNEVRGQPVVICRGLRGTWADVWPELRHYG